MYNLLPVQRGSCVILHSCGTLPTDSGLAVTNCMLFKTLFTWFFCNFISNRLKTDLLVASSRGAYHFKEAPATSLRPPPLPLRPPPLPRLPPLPLLPVEWHTEKVGSSHSENLNSIEKFSLIQLLRTEKIWKRKEKKKTSKKGKKEFKKWEKKYISQKFLFKVIIIHGTE